MTQRSTHSKLYLNSEVLSMMTYEEIKEMDTYGLITTSWG